MTALQIKKAGETRAGGKADHVRRLPAAWGTAGCGYCGGYRGGRGRVRGSRYGFAVAGAPAGDVEGRWDPPRWPLPGVPGTLRPPGAGSTSRTRISRWPPDARVGWRSRRGRRRVPCPPRGPTEDGPACAAEQQAMSRRGDAEADTAKCGGWETPLGSGTASRSNAYIATGYMMGDSTQHVWIQETRPQRHGG